MSSKKLNHFAKMCRSKSEQVHTVIEEEEQIFSLGCNSKSLPYRNCAISYNQQSSCVKFLIDSGAALSIISKNDLDNYSETNVSILPCSLKLVDYNRQPINIIGQVCMNLEYESFSEPVNFLVTVAGQSLLGIDKIKEISAHDKKLLAALMTNSVQISDEYPGLFSSTPGLARNACHKIKLKSNIIPVQHKFQNLPLSLKNEVMAELQKMEDDGIIEKIDASEFVSPLVVVKKSQVEFESLSTIVMSMRT